MGQEAHLCLEELFKTTLWFAAPILSNYLPLLSPSFCFVRQWKAGLIWKRAASSVITSSEFAKQSVLLISQLDCCIVNLAGLPPSQVRPLTAVISQHWSAVPSLAITVPVAALFFLLACSVVKSHSSVRAAEFLLSDHWPLTQTRVHNTLFLLFFLVYDLQTWVMRILLEVCSAFIAFIAGNLAMNVVDCWRFFFICTYSKWLSSVSHYILLLSTFFLVCS